MAQSATKNASKPDHYDKNVNSIETNPSQVKSRMPLMQLHWLAILHTHINFSSEQFDVLVSTKPHVKVAWGVNYASWRHHKLTLHTNACL